MLLNGLREKNKASLLRRRYQQHLCDHESSSGWFYFLEDRRPAWTRPTMYLSDKTKTNQNTTTSVCDCFFVWRWCYGFDNGGVIFLSTSRVSLSSSGQCAGFIDGALPALRWPRLIRNVCVVALHAIGAGVTKDPSRPFHHPGMFYHRCFIFTLLWE